MKAGRITPNYELTRALDLADSGSREDLYSGSLAFAFEHPQNVVRRTIAEELSLRFFVIGNVVLLDQGNEVRRRVPSERGFYEVRICGEKVFRLAMKVCEIAAAATGNQNLLAGTSRALDQRHTPPAFAGFDRAQQSGGPSAENQDVKVEPWGISAQSRSPFLRAGIFGA